MECKDACWYGYKCAPLSIDLTRMECKDTTDEAYKSWYTSIDLTRMECKENILQNVCNILPYRFNQNGM